MVIVYRGKWRWILVHNVYWSNCNFSTATCVMTIIDRRTDKITQRVSVQSSHQYTPNDTHNFLRSSVNPPFRFTRIINYINMFCFSKCIILSDTIPFLLYFLFHSLNYIFTFLPISTTLSSYEMICETNLMQQLWFINKPLTKHVSGIIMPIFRSSRTYITPCLTASKDSNQRIKCWKTYAVIRGLELMKMGTMVLEICRDIGFLINHNCCIKLV